MFFEKNGRQILRAKDENDHPDCDQGKVQKPASVICSVGDLHICEGTIDAEVYVGILETYVAVKTMTFPRNSMSISAGQYQSSFCTSYKSMAL